MQLYIAASIAFILSILLYGIPSYSNFTDLGKDFVWRSWKFQVSAIAHGLLGLSAFWMIWTAGLELSFQGEPFRISDWPYVYALVASFSYTSVISVFFSFLSLSGKKVEKTELRSMSSFYRKMLYETIKKDVDKFIQKRSDKVYTQMLNIADFTVEDFQTSLLHKINEYGSLEDLGWIVDTIKKVRDLETPNEDEEQERRTIFRLILREYLRKHGIKRFNSDFEEILKYHGGKFQA